MISIKSVYYSYPDAKFPALNGINLQVHPGEFVLLAGPSGSGKTSLLRCINGLIPHFSGGDISGKVTIDNKDIFITGPQSLSRVVGFVSQNPENQVLLDRVEPEIAFPMENAAIPPEEMRIRVEEVLDLLDLTPLRSRLISTLSGGERQRVCIASALVMRPKILLLDEPTSQLDPKSAEDVIRSLIRLNEDLGLTIVLSEHRLERILRYVDRLIYMQQGNIVVDEQVIEAVKVIPNMPPLVTIGKQLGWDPLPLTVKEGKRLTRSMIDVEHHQQALGSQPSENGDGQDPLLEADALYFAYDKENNLSDVSFRLFQGESLVIMGRNGSGKSTLLRCLVGLLRPQEGDIRLKDHSIKGKPVYELAQDVAYLPQNPDDLLFADTVNAELSLTLDNHGIKAPGRVEELLEKLDLVEQKKSYPRDLSTGQRQRVALGAVAVTSPSLILLDEPTRGLDAGAKQKLIDIWRAWLKEGKGLIIVTHDVELAALIADRVLIMSQGQIIASGSPINVLGASPLFSPQIARLFPGTGWLTVTDVLNKLNL